MAQVPYAFDQPLDEPLAHVEVQVAQVQQRVAVERRRQMGEPHLVLAQRDAQRVAATALMQPD